LSGSSGYLTSGDSSCPKLTFGQFSSEAVKTLSVQLDTSICKWTESIGRPVLQNFVPILTHFQSIFHIQG
jgi:hypothetical protein